MQGKYRCSLRPPHIGERSGRNTRRAGEGEARLGDEGVVRRRRTVGGAVGAHAVVVDVVGLRVAQEADDGLDLVKEDRSSSSPQPPSPSSSAIIAVVRSLSPRAPIRLAQRTSQRNETEHRRSASPEERRSGTKQSLE